MLAVVSREFSWRRECGVGPVAKITVGNLGEYIREQRKIAQISLRQLAKLAGVSNPYLSQIERGLRRPSAEILQQIAKALRISAEVLYVQAGILEERHGESTVADSVLSDRTLTDRQKQVLLEIYDSFRRENEARMSASAPPPSGAEPRGTTEAEIPADGVAVARARPARVRRSGKVTTGTNSGAPRRRAV
jgi:transcriptional regulator with XRE-family HTH domain